MDSFKVESPVRQKEMSFYEEHNTGLPTMQINHWKSVGFLLQER